MSDIVFGSVEEELGYNANLYRAVQEFFIAHIPPLDFTDLSCISDKLTTAEMEKVKAKHDREGNIASARLLLETLRMKPNWFKAVLQALQNKHLKLEEFIPKFRQLKEKVDRDWKSRHNQGNKTAVFKSPVQVSSGCPNRGGVAASCPGPFDGRQSVAAGPQIVNPSMSSAPGSEPVGCIAAGRIIETNDRTEVKLLGAPAVSQGQTIQRDCDNSIQEGDSPYDHLENPSDLQEERWFFGNMERGQAESILKSGSNPGTYLVRYNMQRKHFCLSIVGQCKILHLKINEEKVSGGPGGSIRYFLDTSKEGFDSISNLLAYFKQHPVATQTDAAVFLVCPAPQRGLV